MKKTGIYIHIPFCNGKCPYCDFYSVSTSKALQEKYVEAVIKEMDLYQNVSSDTIYLGGGTPSVLEKELLCKLIERAKRAFNFHGGEITVEINPSSCTKKLLCELKKVGVNRISMGLQSAVHDERKILGRKSDCDEVREKISLAKEIGFENISLDLMLGVPNQTIESLEKSLLFCVSQGVQHISAYMLKIEEGTPFYEDIDNLNLPCEDDYCNFYEKTVSFLEENGFHQYEISNFAIPGFESRHNLKYWNCDEYIGLGASAHSFYDGKRFYHERNIYSYIEECEFVQDGNGGSFEEYAMLRLRLNEGLVFEDVKKRFGFLIPEKIIEKSKKYINSGYMRHENEKLLLTRKGFLLSNTIISDILQ